MTTNNEAEILRLVRMDDMTGLYNRVYFLERMQDDMLRSQRYGWPLSVLLLSLDNVVEIAEAQGPIVGDSIIATAAAMVRSMARNTDIAARYQVNQFAILLPGTAGQNAESIGERLRDRIGSHLFAISAGDSVAVTCSIGIAEYDSEISDVRVFAQLAEAALAEAQRSGNNCMIVATRIAD